MQLNYTQPASNWHEALPIGNGRLGAMVFGDIQNERLQLNEDTLWSGHPRDCDNPAAKAILPLVRKAVFDGDYARADELSRRMQGPFNQSYLPMADLRLTFLHTGEASNYHRVLDLDRAVVVTRYTVGKTHYTRDVFASAPDDAIFMRLGCDQRGGLSFTIALDSPLHFSIKPVKDGLLLRGKAPNHQSKHHPDG